MAEVYFADNSDSRNSSVGILKTQNLLNKLLKLITTLIYGNVRVVIRFVPTGLIHS